jgi:hypothetical protein
LPGGSFSFVLSPGNFVISYYSKWICNNIDTTNVHRSTFQLRAPSAGRLSQILIFCCEFVMRVPFIFAQAALLVMIDCFGTYSTGHAECLSSANAVWAVHPGSHAKWRLRLPGHEGVKCWFATDNGKVMDASAAGDTIPENNTVNAIPLPLPRPGFRDARAGADRTSLPAIPTGEVRSILIWGTPMRIDPTWEEMFKARELHAK